MGVMTLLGMSLAGALMALVVIAVRAVALRRLPKALFVALWLLVALRLLVPLAVFSPVSVYGALDRVAPEAARSLAQVAGPLPGSGLASVSERAATTAGFDDSDTTVGSGDGERAPAYTTANDAVGADGTPTAMMESAGTTGDDGAAAFEGAAVDLDDSGGVTFAAGDGGPAGEAELPSPAGAPATDVLAAAAGWLERHVGLPLPALALWGVGTLACTCAFGVSYVRSRRRFAASLPVGDAAALAVLAEERARVGLRRAVRLRSCDAIDTPLTYGLLRPRILVPAGMSWTQQGAGGSTGEASERARLAVAHELTHIRRFDVAKKAVLAAALCLHWFNPLAWAMWVLANRDIELACDEAVVRRRGLEARGAYARALIDMEETRGTTGLTPLYSAFGSGALEERIVTIMHIKKTSAAAVLASALLVTGVPMALATTYATDSGGGTTTVISVHPQEASSSADAGVASESGDAIGTSGSTEVVNTEDLLATYEPLGLVWGYEWSEVGGERTPELVMSWQDKQVASVYDEHYGVWIANSLGRTLRANGAIDLVATYDASGKLAGLVEAEHIEQDAVAVAGTAGAIGRASEAVEETGSTDVVQAGTKGSGASGDAEASEAGGAVREATTVADTASESGDPRGVASWFAPYERFGLDYDAQTGRLFYRDAGERIPVRTFVDYDGEGIFSFTDDQVTDGLVLRTVYDEKGTLTGLEEFDGDLAVFTEEP